jgi:hypothetical protein
MFHREPKTGRRPVVENVDGVSIKSDDFCEAVDRGRDSVEAMPATGHVRIAEAREVGGDDMEAIDQKGNQIPEHVTGAREAVQKQEFWRAGDAGFAIEDLETIHVDGTVLDDGHGASPFDHCESGWRNCLHPLKLGSVLRLDRRGCFADHVQNDGRRCDDWRVIDGMQAHPSRASARP